MPDGKFKYLVTYRDHGTKLADLAPLESKRASAVALYLFKLFTFLGAPAILQTDNGAEVSGQAGKCLHMKNDWVTEVVQELKQLWPGCTIVTGRARHSESNGGIERFNLDVERKLAHWLRDNPRPEGSPGEPQLMPDAISPHCTLAACNSPFAYCVGWSVGCYLVRWQINTAWSSSIQQVPYRTVFGQYPRVGISALPLASTVLDSLKTEAALNHALGLGGTGDCDSVLTKPIMEEVRLL